MKNYVETTLTQKVFRVIIALFMIVAGFSHLTFNRVEFQAQVPEWLPMSKDLVVILSGIVEMILGLGLMFWKKQRVNFGWALAIFYVLIFPGNISQYVEGKDFASLDSDTARLIRLFFQPVLIAWALWSSGAWKAWKTRND
ncbi:DoxX family protein [Brumimicrobium oceani]|uniref:DoxX family membrane protein n=1 Tax=Brumimicrobium oceani TaxID=2100725 RepID=A0A2U2XE87_9FLAO|nr:DoxX family membrane protein [Brumimicrobium oceani]PWH86104.1 hypothetical protein DIT68_05995 [Brumimicrobium oceani]